MDRGTMDIQHVNKAIAENYRKLRTRIGIVALAFPIIVVAVGFYWGIGLKPTLSDYYYAKDPIGGRIDIYPVRLWFCGLLFIVGAFLYKYEGFSPNGELVAQPCRLFRAGRCSVPHVSRWQIRFPLCASPLGAVLAFSPFFVVILWYSDLTLQELQKADAAAYKLDSKNSTPAASHFHGRRDRGLGVPHYAVEKEEVFHSVGGSVRHLGLRVLLVR